MRLHAPRSSGSDSSAAPYLAAASPSRYFSVRQEPEAFKDHLRFDEPAPVRIGPHTIGSGCAFALIAGPCVIEDPSELLDTAHRLSELCRDRAVALIVKASFDKANRTRHDSYRGPGLRAGLEVLARVGEEAGTPTTTDVHQPEQAAEVAQVVDLLQIPAFLSRQTDLISACAATGLPLNLKKGQFLAPAQMQHAAEKARTAGCEELLLTERGTCFGYGDLVVDMRSIAQMSRLAPVCFDATHAVQQPGGPTTGGRREFVIPLARAAVAAGAHALFVEVHPEPERARCDAGSQWPLRRVGELLDAVLEIRGG